MSSAIVPDTHYLSARSVRGLEFSAMPRSIEPAGCQKKTVTATAPSHANPDAASISTDQISLEKAEAQYNTKTSSWRRLLKRGT